MVVVVMRLMKSDETDDTDEEEEVEGCNSSMRTKSGRENHI